MIVRVPGSCSCGRNTNWPGGVGSLRAAAAAHRAEAPAGQRAGELGDVVLAVAASHAERMQFHDLAREVFVQPARGCRDCAPSRVRRPGCPGRRSAPDPGKSASPDDVRRRPACPRSGRARAGGSPRFRTNPRACATGGFLHRHREVIRPEMHEPLDERRARGERAHEPRIDRSTVGIADLLRVALAHGGLVGGLRVAQMRAGGRRRARRASRSTAGRRAAAATADTGCAPARPA